MIAPTADAPTRAPVIAHATDLSGDDEAAFVHAAALAARCGARLLTVHALQGGAARGPMPDAAPLLERWGRRGAFVHDRLVHSCCDDIAETLLDALGRVDPALLVAATHARTGLGRILAGSVAEAVAANVGAPTLVLPIGGRGFAAPATGALALAEVLVPLGDPEVAQRAGDAAIDLVGLAGVADAELVLLHVDDGRPWPEVRVRPGVRVARRSAPGPLEAAILGAAAELRASVIVMATRGHDSLRDVLAGSHTERVLHAARRPVLSVPLKR